MIEEFFLFTTHSARIVAFILVPLYLYLKDRDRLFPYLTSLFFVLLITYGLKYGLGVPRPEGALLEVVTPRFPSGHTSFVFTPILFFRSWKGKTLLLFYGAVVAYTRIYFQVHVPLDLAASMVIALTVSFVCLSRKEDINRKLGAFLEKF